MTPLKSSPSSNSNRLFAISQCFTEVGLYLRGVSQALRAGPDVSALSAFHSQMKDVTDRLEEMRDELWLLQYEAQVSREGGRAVTDVLGLEGTPPADADPA